MNVVDDIMNLLPSQYGVVKRCYFSRRSILVPFSSSQTFSIVYLYVYSDVQIISQHCINLLKWFNIVKETEITKINGKD